VNRNHHKRLSSTELPGGARTLVLSLSPGMDKMLHDAAHSLHLSFTAWINQTLFDAAKQALQSADARRRKRLPATVPGE